MTPNTAPTMRRLAELAPTTLALMHGPSYTGPCGRALRDLADAYEARVDALAAAFGPSRRNRRASSSGLSAASSRTCGSARRSPGPAAS